VTGEALRHSPGRSSALPHGPRARAGLSASSGAPVLNAMSVDVEDYFQVEAFAGQIQRESWDSFPRRVERNTDLALEIFASKGVSATFFMLGWVARRHPSLVRRIVEAGHELASHGTLHQRVSTLTADEFRHDVRDSRRLLEDLGGASVRGYRAPSFSIGKDTPWAFSVLAEEGFSYSSSVFPIRHDLYGMPDAPRRPFRPAGDSGILEIPMTTIRLFGQNLPCSGGGYFRLLPYAWSRWALGQVNSGEGRPGVFYFHPWELDPGQPAQPGISWKSRFRHYTNLARMEARLRALVSDFRWDRIDVVFAAELRGV
jgi:polysaccharide deacetylase family protein (PEP-CTERM system associated)